MDMFDKLKEKLDLKAPKGAKKVTQVTKEGFQEASIKVRNKGKVKKEYDDMEKYGIRNRIATTVDENNNEQEVEVIGHYKPEEVQKTNLHRYPTVELTQEDDGIIEVIDTRGNATLKQAIIQSQNSSATQMKVLNDNYHHDRKVQKTKFEVHKEIIDFKNEHLMIAYDGVMWLEVDGKVYSGKDLYEVLKARAEQYNPVDENMDVISVNDNRFNELTSLFYDDDELYGMPVVTVQKKKVSNTLSVDVNDLNDQETAKRMNEIAEAQQREIYTLQQQVKRYQDLLKPQIKKERQHAGAGRMNEEFEKYNEQVMMGIIPRVKPKLEPTTDEVIFVQPRIHQRQSINAKKIFALCPNGEQRIYWSIRDAADALQVDRASITKCCNGSLKTAGGCLFWWVDSRNQRIPNTKEYWDAVRKMDKEIDPNRKQFDQISDDTLEATTKKLGMKLDVLNLKYL